MLILQSCNIIYYYCRYCSALNTNFTDLIGTGIPRPVSCLELASDNFQPLEALKFQHFFQPLSCFYVHCVSCSSLQQSKGAQCTALDQIVRYIIIALISPFLQKSERYRNVVPSLWLRACMFSCYVIVCWQLDIAAVV
jgi:hypothetical protein